MVEMTTLNPMKTTASIRVLVFVDMVVYVGFNDEGDQVGETASLLDGKIDQVFMDIIGKTEGDAITFSKACVLKLCHCLWPWMVSLSAQVSLTREFCCDHIRT